MSDIKVTTGLLWSHAQKLSERALDFSNIIGKYRSANEKMKSSCSAFRIGSFFTFENQSEARFTRLMENLTMGSRIAMNCVFAYEEANTELINSYSGWFGGDVEVNTIGGSTEAYDAEQRRKEQEEWDALVGSQYVNYYDDPKGLYQSRINENANNGWYARDKMQCMGYAWARFEYLTGESPGFGCNACDIGKCYRADPKLELVTDINSVKIPSLAYHSRGDFGHVVCIEKIIVNAEGKHVVYYTAGNQESGKPDGTLYSYVYEDNPGEFEGFVQLK